MTDAELIYLLRMHISDIKWHREPDLSEGAVKVLGEAVAAIAARLAQPTPESVIELADETIDALVERLNMSVKTPIPKPKCECKICRKVSEYRKAKEVQK